MANKVESPTSKDSKLAGSDLGVEISWLPEQIKAVTAGWGGAIARFYPQFLEYWESGARNYELVQNSYLEPLKKIRWAEIISKPEMKVLDVGAGSGWLSAFLSRFEEVSKIDALDADQKNLNKLLPEMFKVMDGDLSKVTPVLGLFEPILQPDAHYDLIVASSSIHHASNLFSVMRELKRVLKPDGKIVILNEIPRNKEFYLNYLMTMTANVFRSGVALRSSEFEASFSANGILYDPGLGDFALGYHHYDNAICTAGLDYKVISTGCIVTGLKSNILYAGPTPLAALYLKIGQNWPLAESVLRNTTESTV